MGSCTSWLGKIMDKSDSYITNENEMEAIVQILAQTQAKPTMSRDKRINHEEEQKTVELAVFLKIVRLIKLLYGNIHLLKPWQKREWCIPPDSNAEFVCKMEDVLNAL